MTRITCDICGLEMKFKERIKSKKRYRIRRFECECGHQQTIFADGFRDIELEKYNSEIEIKKIFKQERENRL